MKTPRSPLRTSLRPLVCVLTLAFGLPVPAAVIINEFMAINDSILADEDGRYSDWVELYNSGTTAVDLTGWYLTDSADNLTDWQFPATNIAPGGFVLVFASDKDRAVPGTPLHTDFKLGGEGEYLGLVKPDGETVVAEYAPTYPPQVPDVSYGIYSGADETRLVATGAACRAHVPTSGALGASWQAPGFDDSGWDAGVTGVGYDRSSGAGSYERFLGLDLEGDMYTSHPGCYIRIPFVVNNAGEYASLLLRMMYDDGYVAYLNGNELARANAPQSPAWDSAASAIHSDSLAVIFEDTAVQGLAGLQDGTNILAIHGLNHSTTSSDLLMMPELHGRTGGEPRTNDVRFFTTPTPGAANGYGVAVLGPLVDEIAHSPGEPETTETLTVTARVSPAQFGLHSVTCVYRVMYGAETAVPMRDDGAHGDGAAGDGVYGALLPPVSGQPGALLRYYITAHDISGNVSRLPRFLSETSAEYLGTVVHDPSIITNVPVCHWFVHPDDVASAHEFHGTRCTLYYLGELYDNIFCRLRGGSSASQDKQSHKFEFSSDQLCRIAAAEPRVDEINLNSMFNDQSYLREYLAWQTLEQAGVPGCLSFHITLRLNREFYGLVLYVEQVDGHFLRREGLDDRGRLFKAGSNQLWLREPTLTNSWGSTYELKRPRDGDFSDLYDLMAPLNSYDYDERGHYMYDCMNIPEIVNYLAAHLLIQDMDWAHKNYFLYRDTYGSGEWSVFGWDKDLTFGHRWGGTVVVATDDGSGTGLSSPFNGNYNTLYGTFYNNASPYPHTHELREMYVRRARTLMDQLLKPVGAAHGQKWYEQEIIRLSPVLKPLADADRAKWGWPSPGGYFNYAHLSFDEGVHELTNEYFRPRRTHLYVTHNEDRGGIIPNAQPGTVAPVFGDIVTTPTNGGPDGEYIELRNTSGVAIDISGWYLDNSVSHTFAPGTVIPANRSLYVSPDVRAFRSRPTSPTTNEERFVQGNYSGRLTARGGSIFLFDANDGLRAYETLSAHPSDAQRYLRVSELMYHPAVPPESSPYNDDDFEFIEFINTGTHTIDLHGVIFSDGISATVDTHTVLGPSDCAVLVRNLDAFATRYTTNGIRIAATYAGAFDNSGEAVEFCDAYGERVMAFAYDDQWYPSTDGAGYALTAVDIDRHHSQWSDADAWGPGDFVHGTPGFLVPEPAGVAFATLVGIMYARRSIRCAA